MRVSKIGRVHGHPSQLIEYSCDSYKSEHTIPQEDSLFSVSGVFNPSDLFFYIKYGYNDQGEQKMFEEEKSQSGNVLFLILIAVALFAALSYAVTQSGRGGGDVGDDQMEMDVAQLFQFFGDIDFAVMRMMTINGCSENEINFDNDNYIRNNGAIAMPTGTHLYAPADGSCDIFHQNGGALPFYKLPQKYVVTGHAGQWRSGNMYMVDAPVLDMGSSADELIVSLGHVSDSMCAAINEASGLGSTVPVTNIGDANDYFNGDYNASATQINVSSYTFCAGWTPDPTHDCVYHVVLAR